MAMRVDVGQKLLYIYKYFNARVWRKTTNKQTVSNKTIVGT